MSKVHDMGKARNDGLLMALRIAREAEEAGESPAEEIGRAKMNDLISRQAAIEVYGDWYVEEGTAEGFIGTVKQLLEGLPSAEPEAVEAIPVAWIEEHIKELQESFASFTGWPAIENMLMKWKEEQK